ncbi:diguanylate cyclase [Ideonella sp. BN130291]|uniref:diguanylate cyclase n=1 Tax=Ideonella sp. BN130291 TaxID=3112940 RepID=UPI002E252829|nr:diguanylate cyclase [Ideonella sp. BN130291]
MRLLHACWLLLLALLCGQAAAAAPVVLLQPGAGRLSLDGRFELLEDRQRQFDASSVLQAGTGWAAAPAQPLNLGHSPSAWWLHLRVANADASAPLQRLIELANPRLDRISLFVLRQGRLGEQLHTGDRTRFATRPVAHHQFLFPLLLAPAESVDLLIRLDAHDGYFGLAPLSVVDEATLQQDTQRHTLLLGLYYGGLGLLLLYHLCLVASTREPSFVLYVGYLVALLVCRFAFEGHAAQYWWPDQPLLVNQALLVAYSASVVLFGALLLVNLREHLAPQPRLRAACWALVTLNALPIPLALLGHYSLTLKLAMPATLVGILLAAVVSLRAWRSGYTHTRYFLAGTVCMLLGLLVERLTLESVLGGHALLNYGVAIGSVLEALFVAVALADGMNRLKADKLQAERLAREAEVQLNEQLGQLVQGRTQELESANRRLNQLAITDELTGAHNRRHFQHELDSLVAQVQRSGGAIGLCLFDLDHFKGYNDHYGHPAGDEVLRCVAATVQATCKRTTDRLFRVGGEEFALLMAGTDREQMQGFVEQIRQAIEALDMPHAKNPRGLVTASFGLAWCAPSGGGRATPDPAAVYRFADQLLYRAKAAGRNVTVCEVFVPAAAGAALAGTPALAH